MQENSIVSGFKQSNLDRCCLEFETMATGHFLALFPVEKTADFTNSLMKKIKSPQFTFYGRPPFEAAVPRWRLAGIF